MSATDAKSHPIAIIANDAPTRIKPSNYPEPFATRVAGRIKSPLGDLFGLKNFGINHTRLVPGGESVLLHRHTMQDEFIYVLEGAPTLVTDKGEVEMDAGMCAGFPAAGLAHQLVNRSDADVVYLEIGDRTKGDEAGYPNDDLKAVMDTEGKWVFLHKNDRPY